MLGKGQLHNGGSWGRIIFKLVMMYVRSRRHLTAPLVVSGGIDFGLIYIMSPGRSYCSGVMYVQKGKNASWPCRGVKCI